MKSKRAGMLLHLRLVRGDDHFVGAELDRVVLLFERRGELHGVRAEGVGELEAHMAESAETDDADLLPRRRPSSGAAASRW